MLQSFITETIRMTCWNFLTQRVCIIIHILCTGVREEYVDAEVNVSKVEEEYEEFQELGPPVVTAKFPLDSQSSSTSISGVTEEYMNLSLPYSELKTMTNKYGPLWRKEKNFIFLEQWRRCWVGIHGHVLLLYNSERDVKPSSSFDIQGFEARPLTVINHKDPKKKDSAFEIVCPGKKTCQVRCSSYVGQS
jgi:hypothetical protein